MAKGSGEVDRIEVGTYLKSGKGGYHTSPSEYFVMPGLGNLVTGPRPEICLRSEFDPTLIAATLQINLAALPLRLLQKKAHALHSALHRHHFNCCILHHGKQQKAGSTGKGASGPLNGRIPFCWYLPAMRDPCVKGASSRRSY